MNMQNYKMIVLDLDGTLTNSKKEITPRTKAALMRIQAEGVKVVLASGRPTGGIMPLAEELRLAEYGGYILAFNGGKIVDCATGGVVYEQQLEETIVPYLHAVAKEAGLSILTYQDATIVATNKADEYVQLEGFINKMPVEQYDDFLNQIVYPLNKCLIVGNPTPLYDLEQRIIAEQGERLSAYRSADFFLECVPLGVDKAQSIDRLIGTLGIDRSEVVACGDGHNDLSMIEYAGLGVAMDNAVEAVKAVADDVTLSNEEDGVAHLIERLWVASSGN
ncbi:MAG: Cof-type HAD-IIB family hydrolase [Bacteroidales bacterium]|nr:Cof-type HAD-IIB family hydrolase [Bacteroidales bacterium]